LFIRKIRHTHCFYRIRKGEKLMKTEMKIKRVHTTVGELIVAIMDAAQKVTNTERDAYRLTGFVWNRMLQPVPVVATRSVTRKTRIRY